MKEHNLTVESFFEWMLDEDNDMYKEGEYHCDDTAKKEYCDALVLAMCLNLAGKCEIKVDDPNKPYYLHTINIRWKFDDDYMIELNDLISNMKVDISLIDDGSWLLSKKIYFEI